MVSIRPLAAVLALGLCAGAARAQTQPLNDTGVTFSGDASSNSTICEPSASTTQDCHNGRDAAAAAGVLTKAGASALNNGVANGFDYTKISNAGNPIASTVALGTGGSDWACTLDNVTGLIWEVKNEATFRYVEQTYTWYDSTSPDGNSGTPNGGSCSLLTRCDTEKFVQDVNEVGLCGHSDWRMPTRRELQSLVDYGRLNPSIDPAYFPNTYSLYGTSYWSGSPYADDSSAAWFVDFYDGQVNGQDRADSLHVRLVRGGH